jgi:hypothetical protein
MPYALLFAVIFFAGLTIIGSQTGLNGTCGKLYPARMSPRTRPQRIGGWWRRPPAPASTRPEATPPEAKKHGDLCEQIDSNCTGTARPLRVGPRRPAEGQTPIDRLPPWDSPPKVRFAPDSPLEETGFEPSVPLYGELGALGRVRRTRAAIVKPGTPDRSRQRARRAICGTPGDGQSRALDRLRRLRASSGVSVRLLGKVRDLSGRSGLSAGKGPNRGESGIP